jgi:pyruvate ferredoxin oxidoreductase delta subunit
MSLEIPLTPISHPTIGASGKTGTWRTSKPIINYDKCKDCLICWMYCPESSIIRTEKDKVLIEYDYCKGCGICANVCPFKAIDMIEEE